MRRNSISAHFQTTLIALNGKLSNYEIFDSSIKRENYTIKQKHGS